MSSTSHNIETHRTGKFVRETAPGKGNELMSSLVADIRSMAASHSRWVLSLSFATTTTTTTTLWLHYFTYDYTTSLVYCTQWKPNVGFIMWNQCSTGKIASDRLRQENYIRMSDYSTSHDLLLYLSLTSSPSLYVTKLGQSPILKHREMTVLKI